MSNLIKAFEAKKMSSNVRKEIRQKEKTAKSEAEKKMQVVAEKLMQEYIPDMILNAVSHGHTSVVITYEYIDYWLHYLTDEECEALFRALKLMLKSNGYKVSRRYDCLWPDCETRQNGIKIKW